MTTSPCDVATLTSNGKDTISSRVDTRVAGAGFTSTRDSQDAATKDSEAKPAQVTPGRERQGEAGVEEHGEGRWQGDGSWGTDPWQASVWNPKEDPVEKLFAYMRDNTEAKDGGPAIEIGLANFEETLLGMLRGLTQKQAQEFAERKEQKGRGAYALWYAVWTNAERFVNCLLELRARIDETDTTRGRTALWEAASQGHETLVRQLLAHAAAVDVETYCSSRPGDQKGTTALKIADNRRHVGVVTLLMNARTQIDAASSSLEEGTRQITVWDKQAKESPTETKSAQNAMTTSAEADALCATRNCDRPAAAGYTTCCHTCTYSEGTGHAASCQKSYNSGKTTTTWKKTPEEDGRSGSSAETAGEKPNSRGDDAGQRGRRGSEERAGRTRWALGTLLERPPPT